MMLQKPEANIHHAIHTRLGHAIRASGGRVTVAGRSKTQRTPRDIRIPYNLIEKFYGHTIVKTILMPLRTPPYYAIKCCQAFLNTIGGIKINHHMEVLNDQDKPIPGLYAAGVDTGGWESDTYCIILAGATFGFAINSGRIAGENTAKYVSNKLRGQKHERSNL